MRRFPSYQFNFSRSEKFFYCLIAFVAGIASGYFLLLPHFYLFCLVLAGVLAMIILDINNKAGQRYFFIICLIISFLAGLWRYNVSLPDYSDQSKIFHYSSTTAEFIGRIKAVEGRLNGQKVIISADRLEADAGSLAVSGLVMVSVPLFPEYRLGEQLHVRCFLQRPGMIEDFDYGKYLAKDGVYVICAYADVYSLGPPHRFKPAVLLADFKSHLTHSLNASVSEPEVSLLRGILLGDGRGLPEKYSLMFSDLGLTHIIAISGDHIAILAVAFLQLLILAGLSRPKAFWPLVVIVAFYVALVGAPASAVRAAIMALSVMYAQKIGRGSRTKNVLVLAAASMIAINPKILLSDVGFQLSFMAVWGLSYISPLISARLASWPDLFRTKEIFIATISAQIATLPLLLHYFGKLSLISVIANILILPIIPFLTIWGLINMSVAAVFLPLGRVLGYVSWLLCAYWIKMSELLHLVPFGYFEFGRFGVIELSLFYTTIIASIWRLRSRRADPMV